MVITGTDPAQVIHDQMIERFRKREEIRSRNMKILSKNDAKDILKLEPQEQVERRKEHIKSRNLLMPREENITLEGLVTGNDMMSINYLPRGQKIAKSVCRVVVKNEFGTTTQHATGFMVSPLLFITNYHVLKRKEECIRTLVQFNYEEDENFLPKTYVSFLLNPELFFHHNEKLDYTVVAVAEKDTNNQIPLSDFGYIRLIGKTGKALIGEFATLIHHPDKDMKRISIRENRIVDKPPEDNVLHYKTDSLKGSSGAPVFNDQWEVIALHHWGIEKRDEQLRILAIDNSVWDNSMGEDKVQYDYNEGIRISKIVEDLKTIADLNQFQGRSKEVLIDFLNLSNNNLFS